MMGLAHRGFGLNDYTQHIVHTLGDAGYHSTLIGMQHVAADAVRIGYDRVVPVESDDAEHVTPAAVQFFSKPPKEPFFLSVGFAETHRPFHEPDDLRDARFCRPPAPLPDALRVREDFARFTASAQVLDRAIGAVLGALDRSGLTSNTLVICTTDHGLAFPGMKCTLTDHGIGVMLIMRGPGGFIGGRVNDALVSHVDLFPTLCDLLEIPRPPWLQGKSILPLIQNELAQINEQIFAEVTYHAAYEPQRAVRTSRWKYIRRFEERSGPVLPNCDDSPSKDVWLEYGWRDRAPLVEQLYDLVFDPNESHNLAADPESQDVLTEMRQRLTRWMQETDDPLLHGPVAAPPGAVANDPDGLSPSEKPVRLSL
jgi:arylsulfatase A-like enzyme